jgi:hypothetical protein
VSATRTALALLLAATPLFAGDAPFVRCDQGSKGRAPFNAADCTTLVSKDFKKPPAEDARKVIAHLEAIKTPFPVYLGTVTPARCEHAAKLAKLVADAAHVHVMFAVHPQSPPPPGLSELAKVATLAVASGCDAAMSREQVRAKVQALEGLKVPLAQVLVSVDVSHASPELSKVVAWALEDAYALHCGGFHTSGDPKEPKTSKAASDALYRALDAAWDKLVAAHPERTFSGLRRASGSAPR